jgi:hypothetical protein
MFPFSLARQSAMNGPDLSLLWRRPATPKMQGTMAALCNLGAKCLAEDGSIPDKRAFLIRAIERNQRLLRLVQRQLRVAQSQVEPMGPVGPFRRVLENSRFVGEASELFVSRSESQSRIVGAEFARGV